MFGYKKAELISEKGMTVTSKKERSLVVILAAKYSIYKEFKVIKKRKNFKKRPGKNYTEIIKIFQIFDNETKGKSKGSDYLIIIIRKEAQNNVVALNSFPS